MQVHWYPGHMAKSKRLLADQIKRVDIVIELCDARLPLASRNPALWEMTRHKTRILVLNKADLADTKLTESWLNALKTENINVYSHVSGSGKAARVLKWIESASRVYVQRAMAKGVRKTVRAMVIGIPNVGKSTFINDLSGAAVAKVADKPGVTRSVQWMKISPYLEVMDTPGLLWPKLEDQLSAIKLCYIGTLKDEIVDMETLAISLLEDLLRICPDKVKERYKLADTTLKGLALLEAACRGRGFLIKGGAPDIYRGSAVVMDEFRAGKLGRITLEMPVTDTKEGRAVVSIKNDSAAAED
ncbi:MAG: ribosome biogenesis GTPase YlqF [Clostridia bacterium]|nr:ribosome biogenesis GTPase YlqF [Clostridia bacterium]